MESHEESGIEQKAQDERRDQRSSQVKTKRVISITHINIWVM